MTEEDKKLVEKIEWTLEHVYTGFGEVVEKTATDHMNMLVQSQVKLLKLRCRLQKEYYQAREKLRVPKDKELTDFDRNTMLQAFCAEKQEEFEYVKGLEEIVKEYLQVIK